MKGSTWAVVLIWLAIANAGAASADPIKPYCYDPRLCQDDFSKVTYCPSTGTFMPAFVGTCPNIVVGPYLPGGPVPNEGGVGGVD